MTNLSTLTIKKAAFFAAFFLISFSLVSGCNNQEQKTKPTSKLKEVTSEDTSPKQEKQAEHSVFLTSYFDGDRSLKSQSFGCEDKVYAVIQFKNYEPKLQQIAVNWEDPNGEMRENNKFPYFVSGKQTFAWSSLSLHRGVGAGMLQWINPAAGMEEFIGEWTVTITVKDLFEEKIKFEVLC